MRLATPAKRRFCAKQLASKYYTRDYFASP
jgi:hypothetical protein